MTYPGVLITFEGDDGAGKSTQVHLLADALTKRGVDVTLVREPGNTVIGEQLRDMLLNPDNADMCAACELFIYEAARAQVVHEVILPSLQAGRVVVCDRFTDSTVAYQAAGRGLNADFVGAANAFAAQGVTPDLTLVLRIDAEEAARRAHARGEADRMEAAGDGFHQRVSRTFARLAHDFPERVVELDASGDEQAVAARVLRVVDTRFPAFAQEGAL